MKLSLFKGNGARLRVELLMIPVTENKASTGMNDAHEQKTRTSNQT